MICSNCPTELWGLAHMYHVSPHMNIPLCKQCYVKAKRSEPVKAKRIRTPANKAKQVCTTTTKGVVLR